MFYAGSPCFNGAGNVGITGCVDKIHGAGRERYIMHAYFPTV
jgi:hypothetical protein